MSKHLKRHFAPRSWKIKRKGIKFIAKSKPGQHKLEVSLPLNVVIRDILGYATNNREVKYILEKKSVMVDNVMRRDYRFPVGLFDILSFNLINEHFRVILDKKGKISFIKINESEKKLKPYKVIGKSFVKGKLQLNLSSGKNILVDKNSYKVGDTLLINLEDKQIKDTVPLEKNVLIYLTGGKHIGKIGRVENIIRKKIMYKTEDGENVETLKEYGFPIGKDNLLIKII